MMNVSGTDLPFHSWPQCVSVLFVSTAAEEDEEDDFGSESEDESDASDSEADNIDEEDTEKADDSFGLQSLLAEDASKQSQVRRRSTE